MSHTQQKLKYINNIKDTVVAESHIHGYGLFATKHIKKGTLLCELSGQIVTENQFKNIYMSNLFSKEIFVEKCHIDNERVMVSPFRTSYGFINHSDTIEHLVEKWEDGKVKVYAKIDIPKNAEIVSIYNLKKHIDILGGFESA